MGSFSHLQPEQGGDITFIKHLRCAGRCFVQRKILSGTGEQFIFIHTAQHEKKLGLFVEPGADTIERRRDVLAHVRPVRTAAGQLDFLSATETGHRPPDRPGP